MVYTKTMYAADLNAAQRLLKIMQNISEQHVLFCDMVLQGTLSDGTIMEMSRSEKGKDSTLTAVVQGELNEKPDYAVVQYDTESGNIRDTSVFNGDDLESGQIQWWRREGVEPAVFAAGMGSMLKSVKGWILILPENSKHFQTRT